MISTIDRLYERYPRPALCIAIFIAFICLRLA